MRARTTGTSDSKGLLCWTFPHVPHLYVGSTQIPEMLKKLAFTLGTCWNHVLPVACGSSRCNLFTMWSWPIHREIGGGVNVAFKFNGQLLHYGRWSPLIKHGQVAMQSTHAEYTFSGPWIHRLPNCAPCVLYFFIPNLRYMGCSVFGLLCPAYIARVVLLRWDIRINMWSLSGAEYYVSVLQCLSMVVVSMVHAVHV